MLTESSHTARNAPRRQRIFEAWDAIILVLVVLSLVLILFDSFYRYTPLPWLLNLVWPALDHQAHWLSEHASQIDLWFLSVFWIDIIAGWLVAIAQHRYHRWFFYPFVHWYDVLGSLPITNFRWFRILRVIGLMVRLQKSGCVDFTQWRFFLFFQKYYNIVMEEISDRVAVKLLTTVQDDIRHDGDIGTSIKESVIEPQRVQLSEQIATRAAALINEVRTHTSTNVEGYLVDSTRKVLENNANIRMLKSLPLGKQLSNTLESAMIDVLKQLLQETNKGLDSAEFTSSVERIVGHCVSDVLAHPTLDEGQFETMMVDTLEMLKARVEKKRWKTLYDDL
ncbi:ion transporter [Carnimonas bestiolae]|uniref:ion transporter n=1 Tax=Carnimonas bestiolae TaxID=3402172 RepID=UPI003EDB89FC